MGHIDWPTRSPNLTPSDFDFWGDLKSIAYYTKPTTVDELQNIIRAVIANSPLRESVEWLEHCQAVEEFQF